MGLDMAIKIDDDLVNLIDHMNKVKEYQESLQSLQSVWDNLTLLGHLSGSGTDMSETRTAFQQLTTDLLNQLGRETLKKTVMEMTSKAQVAVDILIRNLFERTADIGFLAMDGEVRDYLLQNATLREQIGEDDQSAELKLERLNNDMLKRFREYVRKYSVYSNIILLDNHGNVRLQLDTQNKTQQSFHPLVAESLTTKAGYVETFGKTDLQPDEISGLIYSYRVTDAESRRNIGVLCLCFRFANETERIFDNLVNESDWSVITILDREGKVIASSDPFQIPLGAILSRSLENDWKVIRFAGREFLAVTRSTQGYQGYMGPGWCGQVMIPMDHAFKQVQGHALDSIHSNALDAVMGNQQLFSEALRAIPTQAGRIQRELNRTVWNGNVNQFSDNQALNPQFSKILLWEISNTGFKTQDVFERSIGNLHQTVVSSILHDSQFQAALAIDIMDRNLYERANDCRWWALTSVFQSMLSASPSTTSSLHKVNETLTHINGLYTVYDNLVVFDRAGRALAVSNPKYGEFCGQVINESWVHQTLSLNNSQSYTVSDFSTTRLYSGLPTYIFAAPIFDPVRTHTIVGGIGIVFDSTPQFCAMLNDSLPRDVMGNVRPGSFGVFTDRDRRIIASTHSSLNPGDLIDIDDKLFQSEKGQGVSDIAQFNGKYYAVGTSMSKGYREYKDADDPYKSDVLAIIFVPLGVVRENERRTTVTIRNRHRTSKAKTSINDKNSVEIATFYVDSHWIGIVSKYVVEAVDVKGVTGMPGAGENTVGYLLFRNNVIPVVGLWGMLGPKGSRRPYHEGQIVILQLAPEVLLGIMVDELGEIPEIQHELIETVSGMFSGENLLVESIVKPDEGSGRSEMIALISPDLLRRRFLGSKYAS